MGSFEAVTGLMFLVLTISGMLFIFLSKPLWDDFQDSNCATLCPSSGNCTVSENGAVTCNTTDGSNSFSGPVSSRSATAVPWWTAAEVVAVFLVLLSPAWCFGIYCRVRCADCENENYCALGSGQKSHRNRSRDVDCQPFLDPPHSFRTHPQVPSPPLSDTALDDTAKHITASGSLAIVPDGEAPPSPPLPGTALDDTAKHITPGGSLAIVPDGEAALSPPLPGTAFDDTAKHTTVAGSLAIVPDGEAAPSPPLPGTALDDTAKHITAAGSLAIVPDGEAALSPPLSDTALDDSANNTTAAASLAIVPDGEDSSSRCHGPTGSSHHIAAHTPAEPPMPAKRPSTAISERSILFTPEIIVVPDEIMMSSNTSKLFRQCARLNDHVESLMGLDIISSQLCFQVTTECQSHGHMSGLALLYRQVKQAGNEVSFLAALRAHREEIAIYHSSIGSDEAGNAARRPSETTTSSSSVSSLDSGSSISLLRGHEMLMWVQALDKLEDLICEGILTLHQYVYIVDLARQDRQISALMQIVNGCRKQARLQRFLATPPTSTPTGRSLHDLSTWP